MSTPRFKRDFSNQSHEPPHQPIDWSLIVANVLLALGGAHPATIRRISPPREVLDTMILGLVLLGSAIMTSSTVSTVLHFAAGDHRFHILYVLVGTLAGVMQGAIDNLLQYRRKFFEHGFHDLLRAGVRLPTQIRHSLGIVLLFLSARIGQSLSLGLLGGLALILLALGPSLEDYNIKTFRANNASGYALVEKQVGEDIKRTTDELAASNGRINQLNGMLTNLRQDNVRRVVRSRGGAPVTAVSDTQASKLEATLAAEIGSRDKLKADLAQQTASREAEIQRRVEAAPNAIPKNSGLAGQIEALIALTKNDTSLLFIVLAVQAFACALELGPVWISLLFFPASYASYVTLQRFVEVSKIGEHGVRSLDPEAETSASSPTGTQPKPGRKPGEPEAPSPVPPPGDTPPLSPSGAANARPSPSPDDEPPRGRPGGASAAPVPQADGGQSDNQLLAPTIQVRRGRGRPRKINTNHSDGGFHG